jgi:hypothetical protein
VIEDPESDPADARKALIDQAEEVLRLFRPEDPIRNVAIAVVNKLFPEVLQQELASYRQPKKCLCDGGVYHPEQQSPFIVHRECPIHGHEIADDDLVNYPPHYTGHPSGVECITVTEWMGFNLGNAVKYIWRADEKGAPIQDLEKARWYLDREIQRRKKTS